MNNTLHTPGPWKHDSTWGIIKYGKTEICALHSGNLANAHLISAAPDLLEALQECVRVLAEYTQYDDDDGSVEGNARLLGLSAIAKAEGRAK
jgi:hypothetical protein